MHSWITSMDPPRNWASVTNFALVPWTQVVRDKKIRPRRCKGFPKHSHLTDNPNPSQGILCFSLISIVVFIRSEDDETLLLIIPLPSQLSSTWSADPRNFTSAEQLSYIILLFWLCFCSGHPGSLRLIWPRRWYVSLSFWTAKRFWWAGIAQRSPSKARGSWPRKSSRATNIWHELCVAVSLIWPAPWIVSKHRRASGAVRQTRHPKDLRESLWSCLQIVPPQILPAWRFTSLWRTWTNLTSILWHTVFTTNKLQTNRPRFLAWTINKYYMMIVLSNYKTVKHVFY